MFRSSSAESWALALVLSSGHDEYRILVSSYRPEKVRLQLWDRLPHAEVETLNVNLVKAAPEVSRDPLYLREVLKPPPRT